MGVGQPHRKPKASKTELLT
ncbi:hypothetical protein CCACVL1_16929 [Corchorus capsularis]|uniref:Uncharacterized protein n=1 Tax=Corchorus capsularis TaxID=210143 RepID=A0A1R3HV08_COCAP|nr:hypothetical protein CCACVL1_16929 [Corchorus capsularis]